MRPARLRRLGGRHGQVRGRLSILWTLVAVSAVSFTAVLHVYAAWGAIGPVWTDDEIGVLANSRIISGVGAPLHLAHLSYYPGWSVFLAPLWWFIKDPGEIYESAVALTALCGVLLIVPLAGIARRLGASTPLAVTLAAIIAASPSRTVMSHYVLTENFLTLMVAISAYVATRFWQARSVGWAVALGASVAYTFFSHGRAVVLVVVTGLWLLTMIRRQRRAAVSGLISLGVLSFAALAITKVISNLLYGGSSDREGSSLASLLKATPASVAQAAIGQAWYLTAAWAGLSVLGAGTLTIWAVRELRAREIGVATWAVVGLLATLVLDALLVSGTIAEGNGRLDLFMYGRYPEPFVVPFALVGMVLLTRRLRRRTALLLLATVAVINAIFLGFSVPNIPKGWPWAPINMPGLLLRSWPPVGDLGPAPWVTVSVTLMAFTVAFVVLRRWPALSILGVALFFAAGSVAAQVKVLDAFDVPYKPKPQMISIVNRLGADHSLSFDSNGTDPSGQNLYQYWFAGRNLPVFDSAAEKPATELVIGRSSWPTGTKLGALRVTVTSRGDGLWVMPGALQQKLVNEGLVAPAPA